MDLLRIASDSWDFEGAARYRHWPLVKVRGSTRSGSFPDDPSGEVQRQVQEVRSRLARRRLREQRPSARDDLDIRRAPPARHGPPGDKDETASLGSDADGTQATLACEIEPYIDAESMRSAKARGRSPRSRAGPGTQ